MNFKTMLAVGLLAALPAAAQLQLPPPPAPYTPNATVVEDVVARVNDQIITRSDIERALTSMEQDMRTAGATPEQIDARERNLLRDQIDQQLLLSKGKDLDINCETQLVKQLDEIRKQNHLDTMEDLEKVVQQEVGVSYEDFKASLRNACITQQVVQQEVGSHITLSHAEIQQYYDHHKSEMAQQESVRLSEILIPVAADATPAAVDAAQSKANMVVSNLKAGGKFDQLAKLYSGGPTAQIGGDLGVFKRGALAQELEQKTFVLDAGQYTAPIRTRQGFVILEVTQHVHAGVPPLSSVQEQIEEAIYTQKMQPALRDYLTTLREQAYIDISPGFVDTGASPNELKPVNTAYVPPAPKVKKSTLRREENQARAKSAVGKKGQARAVNAVVIGRNGRPKKIKREKLRYGQAPRENLPAAKTGGDLAENVPAQVGPNAPQSVAADATPIANTVITTPVDPNADPLAPKAVVKKKGRYTDLAREPKKPKGFATAAETAAATPSAPTQQETIAQKLFDAPLGLDPNSAAKQKKHKHVKGEKKERLQGKAKPAPQQPVNTGPITVPVQPVKN